MRRALAAAALGGLVSISPASANVISNMNTGAVHPLIQQAHDAASPGHTLFIHPGEHTEWGITLTKNLTLRGGNPSNTIVQAWHSPSSAPSRVFTISGATCSISGLTIRYGLVTNDSVDGGGVGSTGTTRLSNCVVVANACANGNGGGLAGSIYAEQCSIVSNYAGGTDTSGGGVYGVALSNCLVQGNTAQYMGGGAGWSTAYNTTFRGNRAPEYEGGAAVFSTLVGCELVENHAHSGGATFGGTLLRCRIAKNACDISGGAMWQGYAEDCLIESNTASFAGGAYEATLVNCEVTGNHASEDGGGAYGSGATRCTFRRNSSGSRGGAASDYSTLTSCLLLENSASMWGGAASHSLLVNCTLISNSAAGEAGGIYESTARNCIFAYNTAPVAPQGSASAISNSCFFPDSYGGSGNLSADPRFVDLSGGDFRLRMESPCVEAGGTESWMTNATDLAGSPRLQGSRADMGAYEYPVVCVSMGGSHTPPYESWARAATNLQDAANVASNDFLVIVSNGSHACASEWRITNRIVVRSLNGPSVTSVDGQNARRCAIVLTSAVLQGLSFTNGRSDAGAGVYLAAGATLQSSIVARCFATNYGGGIFFGTGGGTVENCVVQGNVAANNQRGGIYARAGDVIRNCLVYSNRANEGGGVLTFQGGIVESCTIADNTSDGYPGGGVRFYQGGEVLNSIVYDNAPGDFGAQGAGHVVSYTCSGTSQPGTGNITNAPRFRSSSDYRLAANSPCINAGLNAAWMTGAPDLSGGARLLDTTVDLGAHEFVVAYVAPTGAHLRPFGTLATAATNVQAALDVVPEGGAIRIAEGRFCADPAHPASAVACVVITTRVAIAALGARPATVLDGQGQRRVLSLLTNATVSGLTLSNGLANGTGGGAYITGGGSLLSCAVVRCTAGTYGGGAFLQNTGVIAQCVIEGNTALTNDGGAIYLAQGGLVEACRITTNTAHKAGGIFLESGGRVLNSIVAGNAAVGGGGPAQGGGLLFYLGGRADHCTVVSNISATTGGGVFCNTGGQIVNSIIYFNAAPTGPNNADIGGGTWDHCCTTPSTGSSCTVANPLLVAGYRLATNSPCLDIATEILSRDIDGQWRPLDSDDSGLAVSDLGAYELMSACADSDWDGMPDGWEQEFYGSPFGCTQPNSDDDVDGDSNLRESIADTDPGDPLSFFRITSATCGVTRRSVYLHSSSNRQYTLESTDQPPNPTSWYVTAFSRGNGDLLNLLASGSVSRVTNHVWDRVRVQVP